MRQRVGNLRQGSDHLGLVAPFMSHGDVGLDVIWIAKYLAAKPTSSILQIFVKALDMLVQMDGQTKPFVTKVTSMDFGCHLRNVFEIMHFVKY